MLVPCISKPPSYLSGHILEKFTHVPEHRVGERKVKIPTAQPDWMCASCVKGKHVCVSRRCVCNRCRVAA